MPILRFSLSILCYLAASFGHALELAPLFQDHMVVQRNEAIRIHGTAQSDAQVSVEFAGVARDATAGTDGRWSVTFKPKKAGGPYQLNVTSDGRHRLLNDIYIGDVWLASGQSNMEWKLKWRVNRWEDEVKDSDFPLIRYFDVPNRFTSVPKTTLDGGRWVLANPNITQEFSAIAWLFAKKAHLEKNVPIGIVDATWGGTPAEAWVPKTHLLENEDYKEETEELYRDMVTIDDKFQSSRDASERKSELKQGTRILDTLNITDMAESAEWHPIRIPNKRLYTDVVWFKRSVSIRKEALVEAKSKGKVTLSLGDFPKHAHIYINGKKVVEKPVDAYNITLDLPVDAFTIGENMIALRGLDDWSNRFKMGKSGQMFLAFGGKKISLEGAWKYNDQSEPKMPVFVKYWQKPATLYNGMIHPIIHFPVKGVIWYQGESNTNRASVYASLFNDLILSWRMQWQDAEMPFLFVQLAGLRPISKEVQPQSDWADLREAQAEVLRLKNTGMAMALDVGDPWDIHPRDKHTVAERLWLSAKKVAYKDKVLASGPVFSGLKIKANRVNVSFKNTGRGFLEKIDIMGFEIKGEGEEYVKADAIIEGKMVVVSSHRVVRPVAIRYGWSDNSNANLYNHEGLPAVPFRTLKE